MNTIITEKLILGDFNDSMMPHSDLEVSLNVAAELDIPARGGNLIRHKIGLLENETNDDFSLLSAVLLLHSLHRKYRKILIHCQTGLTRSVMVTAAYISIVGNMDFNKVLNDIMKARGAIEYNPIMYKQFIQLIPTMRRLILNS